MVDEDDFSDAIRESSVMDPTVGRRELAPTYPGMYQARPKESPLTYKVKYGRFELHEEGNPQLEAIMNSALRGEKMIAWEKPYTTRDGTSFILLKYMEAHKEEPQIKGRRRQVKAAVLAGKKEE